MPPQFAQFSARARVVDLLGREQIADAPTALGELLKNAIDAAASSVRLDYWPEYGCFSASDDGLGMRREEDLLQRWMVLATDSKHRAPADEWMLYANAEQQRRLERKAYGKKGIGRLAMALLGSGTLVWTRWGQADEMQRTLLLVPWTVFKQGALSLDQIRLPMVSLERAATKEDALVLVDQAEEWFCNNADLEPWLSPELTKELQRDFLAFKKALSAPLAFPETAGTAFYVLGASDILANHFAGWLVKDDLFGDKESKDAEGPKAYLAFSNPFLENRRKIEVTLFDNGKPALLNAGNFWIPDDFDRVDHCIEGEISIDGFATLKIRRFQEIIEHEVALKPLPRRARTPGPLRFKIGYVEGLQKTSEMDAGIWSEYTKRLEGFGGFFVYMDDIRVQPYGRTDQDLFEFEKHRSLNAGRYFFSHRRMFGGMFLTQAENSELVEKAGREGFQQTGAYRGMVFWMRAVFIELADLFFGSNSGRLDQRERSDQRRKKQREQLEQEAKAAFTVALDVSRQRLTPRFKDFEELHGKIDLYLRTLGRSLNQSQIDSARGKLGELRSAYQNLWDGFILDFPESFSPEGRQAEIIDSYLHSKQTLDDQDKAMLVEVSKRVEEFALVVEPPAKVEVTREETQRAHQQKLRQTLEAASRPAAEAAERLQRAILSRPAKDLKVILNPSPELVSGDGDLATLEATMAQQQRETQQQAELYYGRLAAWLGQLADGRESIMDMHDLRQELRLASERERHLLELAQLGLVIESVDHDYHAMLDGISEALHALRPVIPSGQQQPLEQLVAGVEHLDERLQFWDPLVRRSRGVFSEITGEEIRVFIQGIMDQHSRQNVRMEYTPKFLACKLPEVKRSGMLGAIHNIVMNGGYWCTKNSAQGSVRFSMHPQGIVISDSGTGIHERDKARIFEPGFSRRPTGRGLGLYIAKSSLQSFRYSLSLLEFPADGALGGANFLVTPPTIQKS